MGNKPEIVPRMSSSEPVISTYLHSMAKKNELPVSGTFELTSRCNFNCKMCYVHSSSHKACKGDELSAEWWISTAKKAVDQGMIFVLLTGGEPLLREDFPLIYSELNKLGLVISINTNGYLLKGEILELFKKLPPNRINISLYGSSDDVYEKFTGVRAFSTITENIRQARACGIDVRLNCSITPDNSYDIENIFNVSKALGLHIKTTPYMYPQVRLNGENGVNINRLSPEDAAVCRVKWSKLKYTTEDFISRAKGMLEKIHEYDSTGTSDNPPEKIPCRAGGSSFWINKDGGMSPCGMFGKSFNIEESGFSEAWKKVREFSASIILPYQCSNCKYRHLCNVCAAACFTETGSFTEVPGYICRFTKETARLIQFESERMEKKNEN